MIEAMKQALEALELTADRMQKQRDAITSLRQAIEHAEKKQAREPKKWVEVECPLCGEMAVAHTHPVLTTPQPQREWVGLTDEEIALVCSECAASAHNWNDISFARAIEAKLKEKNT
jgi:hypothetical protein